MDIYWPPGEYEYIKLVINKELDGFYSEMISHYIQFCKSDKSKKIFIESVNVNKKLLRLPSSKADETLDLQFNIIECYKNILELNTPNFKKIDNKIHIVKSDMTFKTNQDWMKEIIWYGHRSGKYLCKVKNLEDANYDNSSHKQVGPYVV